MRQCVKHSTLGWYWELSSFRDALYHFLVAYDFCTLWILSNELYELLACCIEKKLLELLLCCTECILHSWDDWIINHDQHSLWSWQCSRTTMECNSVATVLALHTARPTYQGSWSQVAGVSLFISYALWVEAYHSCNIVFERLHSALDTETPPFGTSFAKYGRWPPHDSIVGMLR